MVDIENGAGKGFPSLRLRLFACSLSLLHLQDIPQKKIVREYGKTEEVCANGL